MVRRSRTTWTGHSSIRSSTISPSSNGSYDLGSEKGQSTLNGQLAQVQIYNRVLSASEISYLYAGGLGILGTSSPSGLVAGYRLDGSLDDFSGYGYTGTQENSLSWTTTNPCEAYVASVPVPTDPLGMNRSFFRQWQRHHGRL